ncbi:MAG: hypothetical protein HKO54_06400 [Flavobacteriaceae bacterium]|nr:hypothetical protein [Flavobacteriaceae bacterium]
MKFQVNIHFLSLLFLVCGTTAMGQIGIETNAPKSILDVQASNAGSPAPTDGFLAPRIDILPVTNPGADQDGMISFLTTNKANHKKRHHYWDNSVSNWLPFGGEWLDGYNSDGEHLSYIKQAFAENQKDVVIQDNGWLGLGTDNPDESIEVKLPGDNDIQISSANAPNAPNFHFVTYNGTFASRDFLNDDDPIGSVAATAWDGSGESNIIASVTSKADGDHSSGNLPSKFDFSTTGVGFDNEADNGIEMTIEASGNIGIGVPDPTAFLEIKAGKSAAGSAPIKFKAGTNMTTPERGTFEYDGTHLYFTPDTERRILLKGLSDTANLTFIPLPPDITDEVNVTVNGATVGSSCECTPLAPINAGLTWSCYVSAANTATVRLTNIASSVIFPNTIDWKVSVVE